jgi:hypothetical protein
VQATNALNVVFGRGRHIVPLYESGAATEQLLWTCKHGGSGAVVVGCDVVVVVEVAVVVVVEVAPLVVVVVPDWQ